MDIPYADNDADETDAALLIEFRNLSDEERRILDQLVQECLNEEEEDVIIQELEQALEINEEEVIIENVTEEAFKAHIEEDKTMSQTLNSREEERENFGNIFKILIELDNTLKKNTYETHIVNVNFSKFKKDLFNRQSELLDIERNFNDERHKKTLEEFSLVKNQMVEIQGCMRRNDNERQEFADSITRKFQAKEDAKANAEGSQPRPVQGESSRRNDGVSTGTRSSKSSPKLIYSYKNNFNAFVALLTNDEVQKILLTKGVISVFPNKINHILTTRSWDFIGFPQTVKRQNTVESDIIIGVLDTGIWPESNSFIDEGFGPPPSKWKGSCEGLTNFTCNNKIIGARYYNKDKDFNKDDIESPRDTDGHGTHVASIIAGGLVSTSFYGLSNGTARGGVPSSRIAVYKVCWSSGCLSSDIMTAFDDAINDGVDIISYSLGQHIVSNYFNNVLYIGSFHAMTKGILTTMAGGNNGPGMGTIGNISPWALTVAASRTDRKFITNLKLGDGTTLEGISVNTFDPNGFFPIVHAANVKRRGFCLPSFRFCRSKSLNPRLVKGKIIVYDELHTGEAALLAGAVGMVLIRENISSITANIYSLPTTLVGYEDGRQILNYINRTRKATANIMKSYEIVDEFAPYISPDSSRGPNTLTFGILKPDLSAPGDNILAAWTLANSPTNLKIDRRRVPYSIQSGTSMACPHVSAAAAYVKSFNPSWSPSAIKSALMTTAFTMSAMKTLEKEFGYGAGLINPIAAIDPGLVYDANKEDYIQFLCSLGYTNQQMHYLTGDNSTCTEFVKQYDWNLNMPSFCFLTLPLKSFKVTFLRKVTNVGLTSTTYNVKIDSSEKLKIHVFPDTISFTGVGQTQSFTVTVEGIIPPSTIVSASLSWVDVTHKVRSPIVIYTL
ncbi:cucumisin-like [Impatiens glandulifera]|uniref:cucumisin-like n=1 Tax=Impatiens glandulifera TaxID=253017 RepID=UPI001FB0EFA1|nr:cucumisin-like [Impatiens glandulifera]